MTTFVSPGVYVLEKDLSQYVSDLSSTIVAMVGTADKGPTNTPTLITSAADLVATFGNLNPNHYLGYAALAYLKQGSILYITRVSAADAAKAKLTVPVPASYTAYSGTWVLTSQTANSATFTISNDPLATDAGQLVVLPATPPVLLPGFDFTDTTGIAPINAKLGSDLKSFVLNTDLTTKYVKGRKFEITSGVGKDSYAYITDMVSSGLTTLDVTVNASTLNPFNSPVLATSTGSVQFAIVPSFTAATAVDLFKIGSTSTGGSVKVHYDGTNSLDAATFAASLASDPVAALNGALTDATKILRISGTDVILSLPVYNSAGAITANQAKQTAVLAAATLNALVTIFRSGTTLTGQLLAVSAICKATANGIIGVGSVDAITGVSNAIKSATVSTTDAQTVVLASVVVGALGNFDPAAASPIATSTKVQISGSFSTDLFRPTWVVSPAGTSTIPTLFKFSSVGEADLSDISVNVGINNTKTDASGNKLYTVSLFKRIVSTMVSSSSTAQSDFLLLESFEGTPEVLQSTINANSAFIQLKIDYSTTDTIDYHTGLPLTWDPTSRDYLTSSFALVGDASGLGAVAGQQTIVSGSSLLPAYSTFLLGGTLGTTIGKSDILGDSSKKTGIYSFADPEQIDVNLLLAPGWSADPSVAKGMVALCEKRSDCMAILDTPFGLSVQNVINYKNNVLNIDSNYAAIYYPWVKITDTTNAKDIFVPPSGLVAGQYAYNDLVGEVFSAPAGRNRGNLTEALATERILNQGDRDLLTLAHINPIHFEAGYGIYIRGQMTMQSATTALDRVNVRRLLLNLRKVIATASKSFEFEPGDAITALRLKQLAESTLEDRQRKGAIRSYSVDVGPTVNTVTTLENNELRMVISLVPTKTAEKIIETFNILGQGQGISLGA